MQVTSLTIERAPSYKENAGQFTGNVQMAGELGKQEVSLSATAISKIFAIIKEEIVSTAKFNAKQTDQAIQSASDEPLVLEHSHVGELNG